MGLFHKPKWAKHREIDPGVIFLIVTYDQQGKPVSSGYFVTGVSGAPNWGNQQFNKNTDYWFWSSGQTTWPDKFTLRAIGTALALPNAAQYPSPTTAPQLETAGPFGDDQTPLLATVEYWEVQQSLVGKDIPTTNQNYIAVVQTQDKFRVWMKCTPPWAGSYIHPLFNTQTERQFTFWRRPPPGEPQQAREVVAIRKK